MIVVVVATLVVGSKSLRVKEIQNKIFLNSDISLPSANIAPFVTNQIEQFGSGICFEDGLTGESYSFTQLLDKVPRSPCLHSTIDICQWCSLLPIKQRETPAIVHHSIYII